MSVTEQPVMAREDTIQPSAFNFQNRNARHKIIQMNGFIQYIVAMQRHSI